MTELETLIADQARDMRSYRMGGTEGGTRLSIDAVPEAVLHSRPRGVASDSRHGTENLYQRRCRCDRCRAAHAAYRAERRRGGKEPTK